MFRVFLIVLFCYLSFQLIGQHKPSRAGQEAFLDYATLHLTGAFMEDLDSLREKEESSKKSFAKRYLEKVDEPLELYPYHAEDAETFLQDPSNNWKPTGLKVFREYRRLARIELKKDSVTTSLQTVFKYVPTRDGLLLKTGISTVNRDKVLKNLQLEWESIIGIDPTPVGSSPEAAKYSASEGDSFLRTEWPLKTLFYILLGLLIFSGFFIFLLMRKINQITGDFAKMEAEKNDLENNFRRQRQAVNRTPEVRSTENMGKEQVSQSPLERIEDAKAAMLESPGNSDYKIDTTQNEDVESSKVSNPEHSVKSFQTSESTTANIFYISVPEDDNMFYKGDATRDPDDASLYKFIPDKGIYVTNEASPDLLKNAFNSPEMYLERACKFRNSLDQSVHRGIETIEPGKFRVEGENIVITRKAEIKFI